MTPTRQQNVTAAQWFPNGSSVEPTDLTNEENVIFGSNVFSIEVQRERLSGDVFDRLQRTLEKGEALDVELADEVAAAMKEWALEHGATHFTHVFQPLTGLTAEKHDSFFDPTPEGGAIAKFRGSELIQGEPDASSFPSGGIRTTFEARGYTAWDPTSPAFLLDNPNGTLLCIPTAFASWTGEALDAKIPLLRSMDSLSRSAVKALRLLGDDESERVVTTVGPEQEYFLIDEQYYYSRPDLILTGRTLFGTKPAKGHELDDHYFGAIPERVLACMLETEQELAKLGVPIKTRHNEVAPAQYEIAPMFENSNVGSDHQQLLMQIMQSVARKYGLVCLLHEKPFAGVNGSGKHNNWSMGTDTGHNLLDPGDTPAENLSFLFFCAAVMQAVNKHQGLLRATVANIGQDHRLGANEAPPAIISIFLGGELEKVFDTMAAGEGDPHTPDEMLEFGAEVLPDVPRHGGDRNRTSPFAFTGNKFEFRALGSSMSLAFTNTVLNTIVAEAIDDLAGRLEASEAGDLAARVFDVVAESYRENRQICFDGDGYSDEWQEEAARRGLKNLRTTPDALPEVISDATVETFEKYNVLSKRELEARYEVWVEQYAMQANIEAETAATMSRTQIIPATLRHLSLLDDADAEVLEKEARGLLDDLVEKTFALEEVNQYPDGIDKEGLDLAIYARDEQLTAMHEVRVVADRLERIVTDDLWPLPKYSEMLFIK
jgi:glutamine synthetase